MDFDAKKQKIIIIFASFTFSLLFIMGTIQPKNMAPDKKYNKTGGSH